MSRIYTEIGFIQWPYIFFLYLNSFIHFFFKLSFYIFNVEVEPQEWRMDFEYLIKDERVGAFRFYYTQKKKIKFDLWFCGRRFNVIGSINGKTIFFCC